MEELENFNEQVTEEIEEYVEQPIKVYIKINENNEITEINSEIFISDLTDWIKIDEGFGDKYAHAQSQYFDKSILKDEGGYTYKYIDNKIVEND